MNITVASTHEWLNEIKTLFPGEPISTAIRQAAMSALDNKLKAKPFTSHTPHGETVHTSIALMSSHESKLKRYMVENGSRESHSVLVSFLANAWLYHTTTKSSEDAELDETQWYDEILKKAGMQKRKEQEQLIANLYEAAGGQAQTSLHEASTGVGKTLAILLAAIAKYREKTFTRIVIAVPTQAILKQFENLLPSLALGEDIQIGIVRARTSFLSHYACEYMIENEDTPLAIKAKLQQVIDNGNYRASELAEYENEIALNDLILTPEYHENDLGGVQYEQERQYWPNFNILITTHSMIALDSNLRRIAFHQELKKNDALISFTEYSILAAAAKRKGDTLPPSFVYINAEHIKQNSELFQKTDQECKQLLPYYDGLFIDEAHLFPEMVSLSLQNNISLYALMLASKRALENKSITKTQFQIIEQIWLQATTLSPNLGTNQVLISQKQPNSAALSWLDNVMSQIDGINKIIKKCNKSTNPHTQRLLWQLKEFIAVIERFGDYTPIEISFSPVQKYPRLTTYGSNDLALSVVNYSWLRTKHTAYVSATLSLNNGGLGEYNDAINRLTLVRTKTKTFPPIMAKWLFEGVSVYLHKKYQADTTKPAYKGSTTSSDVEQERYFDRQAEIISKVVMRQAGGTLVLCTSYSAIRQLQNRLSNSGVVVVCSSPSLSINRCIEQFIEHYRVGERVIWLATGAAWVGLDVTDKEVSAEQDKLFQTLFIQQLPYPSINEGNKNNSFMKQQGEALLKMKQGVGRLVRRAGRSGMEIHVIDGRIHEQKHCRFLQLFAPYPTLQR